MKIKDLFEQPIMGGELRDAANKWAKTIQKQFEDEPESFQYTADIDEFKVLKRNNFYCLLDHQIIAIMKVIPSQRICEVDDVWVDETYVGKKIFSKMLWFLKSREGFDTIIFGSIHSSETIAAIRNGGFSKFRKSWINPFTSEKKDFDPADMDSYYNTSRWKFVLESTEELDDLVDLVKDARFSNGESWIKESYDWQINL